MLSRQLQPLDFARAPGLSVSRERPEMLQFGSSEYRFGSWTRARLSLLSRLYFLIEPLCGFFQRRNAKRFSLPKPNHRDDQKYAASHRKKACARPPAGNSSGQCKQGADCRDPNLQSQPLRRVKTDSGFSSWCKQKFDNGCDHRQVEGHVGKNDCPLLRNTQPRDLIRTSRVHRHLRRLIDTPGRNPWRPVKILDRKAGWVVRRGGVRRGGD